MITREQIDTIIRDQIELECVDWDRYRIIGQTEAVDEILVLIEKEHDPLVKRRIEDIEQALEEIRWIINDDPAGRKLAKIERVLDRVIPLAED